MKNIKAKYLTTFYAKSRGLLAYKKLIPVYFETRFGIHTFGMKKPIDIYVLDNNNRVVKIKRSMTPENVFFWNPQYSRILETPINHISVKVGETLNIIPL